jgi:hypothetical protein
MMIGGGASHSLPVDPVARGSLRSTILPQSLKKVRISRALASNGNPDTNTTPV